MFCPTCGNRIQSELNYCNRCGAKVSGPDTPGQPTFEPVSVTENTTRTLDEVMVERKQIRYNDFSRFTLSGI
jgi:predicted amidophosphoribosyltransferase